MTTTSGNMGKLLVNGSGKGNKAIYGWIFFYIASAVLCFVAAQTLGYTRIWGFWGTVPVRNPFWYIFIVLGIINLIFIPIVAVAISKTYIKVCELGVMGRGISKWFYMGDVRSFDFMLTYDQVSVDVNGGQIVVHGLGTNYKVYVENGPKIQQTVVALQQVRQRK